MAEQARDAFHLREEFNTQAMQSRAEGNLTRKAVFDKAVQTVSMSVFAPSYEETADRVRRVLQGESQNSKNSAEQQGYYREAILLLDLFSEGN
jgi:hypothetical protein